MYEDIDQIKSQGLAQGGSLENAVVVKVGCSDGVSTYSVIKFDDGTTMTVNKVVDRKVGVTGANGSPIGIYAA